MIEVKILAGKKKCLYSTRDFPFEYLITLPPSIAMSSSGLTALDLMTCGSTKANSFTRVSQITAFGLDFAVFLKT